MTGYPTLSTLNYSLTLVAAPTGEPITIDEAIAHLRIPEEEDEDLILGLIAAVRQYFEDHDDRRLCTQAWKLTMDSFPCWEFEIPMRPVQSITSIKYRDIDGVLQTLDPSNYAADLSSFTARVTPSYGNSWPSTRHQMNAVEVEFIAGYGDAVSTAVPSFTGSNYFLTFEPSWAVNVTPSVKTTAGFHVQFDAAAPAAATLGVRAEYNSQTLAQFTVDIAEAATEADIEFPATLAAPSTIVGGIPKHIKLALLLLLGHFYENRENSVAGVTMQNIPLGYDALIGASRRMLV